MLDDRMSLAFVNKKGAGFYKVDDIIHQRFTVCY